MMSAPRRITLGLGLLAIAAMGLFPPRERTGSIPSAPQVVRPLGYHFIFATPHFRVGSAVGFQIDYAHLLIQWLVVAALIGVAMVMVWPHRRTGS